MPFSLSTQFTFEQGVGKRSFAEVAECSPAQATVDRAGGAPVGAPVSWPDCGPPSYRHSEPFDPASRVHLIAIAGSIQRKRGQMRGFSLGFPLAKAGRRLCRRLGALWVTR